MRQPSQSARAEAAAWIARLHGPQRSADLEAGLHRWLAENADNARAFERMTGAWEDATSVATKPFPRLRSWNPPMSRRWAHAAAVLLIIGITASAALLLWERSTYTTRIGEQRIVRLHDGSRVSLNSASRVTIEYRGSVRRVRLHKGEAFFEVAPNASRPFVVSAGNREIKALGTSFSVRYELDRLAVVLVDGAVAVSSSGSPPAVTLSPGERLTVGQSNPPKLDAPSVEAVTAWRRGEVVLQKTALTDAVAEMNRYDELRLVIDDPEIGGLLVSGIYRTGDSTGFARAIEVVHGIEAVHEGKSIHLRSGRLAAQ